MAEKRLASFINHSLQSNYEKTILRSDNVNFELKSYQYLARAFFVEPEVRSLLLYWEPGFGKTLACIAIIKKLFDLYPHWTIMLFVQSQLVDDPWKASIKGFLEEYESNFIFIKYDVITPEEIIHKHRFVKKLDRIFYVFDEVHNFIKLCMPSENREKKFVKNKKFFNFICDNIIKGSNKILAMSATPVHNNSGELAYLLQLLRPNIFNTSNEIFTQDGNINYPDALKSSLWGLTSVQRRSPIDIFLNTNPSEDNFAGRTITKVNLVMSNFQSARYILARNYEQTLATRNLRSFTLRAATLALLYTGTNKKNDTERQLEEFKAELVSIKFSKDQISRFAHGLIVGDLYLKTNLSLQPFDTTHFPVDEALESGIKLLHDYSCKYMKICHLILNTKGKCIIYEPFVSLAGINTLKLYLDIFGITYIEYTQNTAKTRTSLVEDFNSDENIHGEQTKVCMISLAGEVGITFKDIERLIFASIPWSDLEQIMGRALRLKSHVKSGIENMYVDILVATTEQHNYSVDREMLHIIARKEFTKRQIFEIFNATSIDRVHESNPFVPPSNVLTEEWMNITYEPQKQKSYLEISMHLTPIHYSFDPNFSTYYSGFLDKSTSLVYINNELLGELVKEDNIPVFKLIDGVLVFLVKRKTEDASR